MITELPYGVTKGLGRGLIQQIADGWQQRTLEGISDLRDETSEENGICLVLESIPAPTRTSYWRTLYEHTDLQIGYPVRIVARLDGEPRTLTLRDLIAKWVAAQLQDQPKDALRQQLLAVAERHHDPRRTTIT